VLGQRVIQVISLPQKNFVDVMKEAFANLWSPEGENYCMSNNKHLNST